jgi:hypothetical protein
MTAPNLIDDLVSHHIGVQRVAASTKGSVDKLFADLRDRVANILKMNAATLQTPAKSRVAALLASLQGAIHDTYSEAGKLLLNDLHEFVGYEADFQTRLWQRKLKVPIKTPSPKRLSEVIDKRIGARHHKHPTLEPFAGVTVKQVLAAQEKRAFKRIKTALMLHIAGSK